MGRSQIGRGWVDRRWMDGRLLRGDQFSHTELQFRQVGGLGFAAFRLGRLSNFLIYAELSQAGESHSPHPRTGD